MSLIGVVVTLAVIGVLLYLFNVYVTMIDAKFKQLINIIVIIAAVIWLLSLSGVMGACNNVPFPRVH